MIKHHQHYSTRNIFFNADEGGGSGAADMISGGVSAAESPTLSDIPTASPATPSSQVVSPEIPERPTSKVISPAKALGLSERPRNVVKSLANELKDKVNSNTTPLPKKNISKADVPVAKAEKVAVEQPEAKVEEKPTEQQQAVAKPVEQPAKIKVAGKEYTAEEIEKLLAEKQQAPEQAEQKPQAIAGIEEQVEGEPEDPVLQDLNYITGTAQSLDLKELAIDMSEDDLDTILSGGKEGLELFQETIAKVTVAADLRARKWVAENMQPLMAELTPVLEQQRQIQAYQFENDFYSANPDLKNAQRIVRSVDQAARNKDPQAYSAMSKEQRIAYIAENARNFMKNMGINPQAGDQQQAQAMQPVQAQEVVNVAQPKAQPKPQPKPPVGQVGGGNAPAKIDFQKSAALSLRDI